MNQGAFTNTVNSLLTLGERRRQWHLQPKWGQPDTQ
jgi:hypothetical protein